MSVLGARQRKTLGNPGFEFSRGELREKMALDFVGNPALFLQGPRAKKGTGDDEIFPHEEAGVYREVSLRPRIDENQSPPAP